MSYVNDLLGRESKLKQLHPQTLVPFFRNGKRVSFTAKDKTALVGFVFESPKPIASIVLVPGRTESTYKYTELIYDLNGLGFTVYSIDHRGQGESARVMANKHIGHVNHFNDYVDDLELFVDQVVKPSLKSPLFFLGHSMGCAALALYLLNRPRPEVKGVIFSAPMFEINFGKFPSAVAAAIANLTCALGMKEGYVTGTGPVDLKTYGYDLSSSDVRVQLMREMLTQFPELSIGGPSNGWLKTSIEANSQIMAHKGWKNWTIPTLLLDAGKDQIVMRRAFDVFSQINAILYRVTVPESQHEIFFEKDEMRVVGIRAVEHFISDHCV